MTELENQILEYQKAYYDGEPLISDQEFDDLWDKLRIQQPDSVVLRQIGSDTSAFPKANHVMVMGSQNKAANEDQFEKWFNKQNSSIYIVQHKLDGASLELQYKNGKLTKAVTRGNGTIGDDITPNAVKMKGVPKNINSTFTGAVRGEVLLFKSNKEKYFPNMANCRNASVGTMKQKEGNGCEYLNFLCYDIAGLTVSKESEKLEFLRNNFNVVPHWKFSTIEEIITLRNEMMGGIRDTLDYDIDGLVIKCENIDEDDLKRDRPEHQIAFKFELEYADTELLKVEFRQSGKTFTPVAHVNPVELCGTTVKQASLHNMDIMGNLINQGMMLGSIVRIVKRGEIIPYVEAVLS